MKSQLFSVNPNTTLSYFQGPNNGPAVLIIAGPHECWQSYLNMIKTLEANHQVFAITLNGNGSSSKLKQYNYESVATPIAKFIQEKIGRSTMICASSLSGLIAVWLAKYYPNWVSHLVLENTPFQSSEYPRIQKEKQFNQFSLTQIYLSKAQKNFAAYVNNSEQIIPNFKSNKQIDLYKIPFINALNNRQNLFGKTLIKLLPKRYQTAFEVLSNIDYSFSSSWLNGSFQRDFKVNEALGSINQPILLVQTLSKELVSKAFGNMDYLDVKKTMQIAPQIVFHRIIEKGDLSKEQPLQYLYLIQQFITLQKGTSSTIGYSETDYNMQLGY